MAPEVDGSQRVNVFGEVQRLGGNQEQHAALADALRNVSAKELEEIRHMRKPPVVVRRTIEVVCLILEAATHPAPASPPTWTKVRIVMERDFIQRVLNFDVAILHASPRLSRYLVAEYFACSGDSRGAHAGQERLTYQRVHRASPAAAALFRWCCVQLDVSEDGTEAVEAPSLTSFSTCPARYVVSRAIPENCPTNDGGVVTSYSVSPPLPDGLILGPTTGVLSGTPSAVADGQFVVTATGPGGESTFCLGIEIIEAPMQLRYTMPLCIYVQGQAIEDNTPVTSGCHAIRYSVAPDLPPGLSLHSSTGVISGTPDVITGSTAFTITAVGTESTANFALDISVIRQSWQVFTNLGWQDDPTISAHAELASRRSDSAPDVLEYSARGFDYRVDFRTMQQLNKRTGKARRIRKITSNAES